MIDIEEYLIAYANLKSGLFINQKNFANPKVLNKFYQNQNYGFPICLPDNIKYFDYSKAKFFKIDEGIFSSKIFSTKNKNYVGVKKFFRYGNKFAYNASLKKKYEKKFLNYVSNIKNIKKKITDLKLKKKSICAMQIRNIPHFGHEAIFNFILSKFDILVLNPIYGIKKKNDFSNKLITKALRHIKKKYPRIKFLPLWSNFHYAGPREALHHMSMREKLCFDYFYIGRDHAGAENLYDPDAAARLAKKYKKSFKIKLCISKGGFYCRFCNDYVIKNTCNHNNLIDISGTEFRMSFKNKKIYKHAELKMQKILFKI